MRGKPAGMCGRYATTRSTFQLSETFQVAAEHAEDVERQDYNVSPDKHPPIVLSALAPDADKSRAAVRQIRLARWGIKPAWMNKAGNKSRPLNNARVEGIDEKPTFRRPFAQRRCLVPADGYYEWHPGKDEAGKSYRQPYYFTPTDGEVLAMAGIVEWWHDPDADEKIWIPSFSIITTEATDEAGRVHDRTPMTVQPANWDAWLDPALTDAATARAYMAAPAPGSLDIFPVSRAVSTSKNNGPSLIVPIDLPA